MFNAVTKRVMPLVGCTLIAVPLLCSCGDSGKEKAEKMYSEATDLYDAGQYNRAIAILDSIDSIYPEQVEIRREAMHLKPMIIEKQTVADLSEVDSLLAVANLESENMAQWITFVKNPVEGYYVAAEQKGKDVTSAPGIYPRMTPDGQFYIVATINKPAKSTAISISLSNGNEAKSSAVPFDGERNDRMNGYEVITFMQAECDTIGALACANPTGDFMLNFIGEKTVSMPLPLTQLQSLISMYEASDIIKELKVLQLRKTRLERQLALARSQIARTFNDKDIE